MLFNAIKKRCFIFCTCIHLFMALLNVQFQHSLLKVAAGEFPFKNGFINLLHFFHGKLLGGADVFVHNLKNASDGYAVLLVNPREDETSLHLPADAMQYLLTADDILSKDVKLNGKALKLASDDNLPEIQGRNVSAGELVMPSKSIMFLTFNTK